MMSYDERKAFDEEQKNKGGLFSMPAIPGIKKEDEMMAMDAAKDAMMGGEMWSQPIYFKSFKSLSKLKPSINFLSKFFNYY